MRYSLSLLFIIGILSFGCAKENAADPGAIFQEFWEFVDKNYIYFDEKEVDWDELYQRYSSQISAQTTDDELFALMEAAILELKDAHCRLFRPVQVSKAYPYTDGYEVHFDPKLVKSRYVQDSLGQEGKLYWASLNDSTAYIYLPEFNDYLGMGHIFRQAKERGMRKLIIDVRGNRGGDSDPVPALIGLLVHERTYLGAYIEKNGPGHHDTTIPIGIYTEPSPDFHLGLPIVVLTDRACYSATSYFAAMMKGIPGVTVMGQRTGGGGGGNLGYHLSNGWQVAVSVSDFLDKQGQSIEIGVQPDLLIENRPEDLQNGRDVMLERAMRE